MRKLRHRIRKYLAQGHLVETLEFSAIITTTLPLWIFERGSRSPRVVVDFGVFLKERV